MAEVINLKPMKYKNYEITFKRISDSETEFRIVAFVKTRLVGVGSDMTDAVDKARSMIDKLKR